MKSTLVFFIIILYLLPQVQAQENFSISDSKTLEAIEGVYVFIRDAQDKTYTYLSNKSGEVSLENSITFPCQISFQHLNYENYTKEFQNLPKNIQLTAAVFALDNVVVTGQYAPQNVKNSLYNIKTISSERIEAQGALKLNEVFAQQLNIRLNRDPALGATSMQLQGIGGQNIKVLIDGVPLVGRLGTAIDLEQINTYNIERIEIVEGPMSVNYGTNALGGVINIITKKKSKEKINVRLAVQEESVGNEFSFFEEGVHNQNLSIGYNINTNFYVQLDGGRNYFGGFQGQAEGRQKDWQPKSQLLGSSLFKFQKNNFEIFYRLDYLNEVIEVFGALNENTLRAVDETYTVNRFIHQLQTKTKLRNFADVNALFSFSDYKREKRRFSKNLVTLQENLTVGEGDQDTTAFDNWNLRGTINNFEFLNGKDWNFELGYDINLESGEGGRIDQDDRTLQDYAVFASAEINILDNLTARPALRWAYNSRYDAPLIPSLNLRYAFAESWIMRLGYGRGFRAPSLRELYFEFVDSNHNIFGNENLSAELAHHLDASLSKNWQLNKASAESQLSVFYNDIEDMISLAGTFQDDLGNQAFRFINIDKFKTTGLNFTQSLTFKGLQIKAGFAYIGRFQNLATEDDNLRDFLFTPEFNTQLTYKLPKSQTSFNIFYKYTGRLQQYQFDANNEVFTATTPDYSWLDATVSQNFWKQQIQLTAGVKNLLDLQNIQNSASGGAVHGGGNQVQIAYGRSYFLRLVYNFKIKKTPNLKGK